MRKKIHKIFIFSLVIIGLISCYEPNEACLDFYASNYDLSADEGCLDCCEFPDLIMQFSHRLDSSSFEVNDTIIDDFNNAFVFNRFNFLISEIELIDTADISHFIEDSILIVSNGSSSYKRDDFTLISSDVSSYTIGSVKIKDPITKVKFVFGINLENVDITNLEDDYILSLLDDTYYDEERYIPWRLQIEKDTISADTVIIDAEVTDLRLIEVEKEINNTLGSDIRVPIIIEYRKLLEGINMLTMTDIEIRELINNNISKTFD